ncbi:MAG: EamA family transporter, partial [Collinsella sp.]
MDRKKAIALSFSVPVAWGFSYPLMKIGMDSMNATSIVALRCIIAFVVCLLLFHKRALHINRDLMVRAAIIGAIMATELTCMCLGSSLTSASTAGFLQSLTVVI